MEKSHPSAFFYTPNTKNRVEAFRVFEDSRGDIWIGTQSAKSEALLRWEQATGILHQVGAWEGEHLASAFAEDRAGNIWIGSSGSGLARYRGGRLQFFHVEKHGPDSWVETIYGDSQGRLWVAMGDQGILRIDKPDADLPGIMHLTTADGLSSNQTRSIIEDRWGRIYVGGTHGIDRFYPRVPLRVRQYTNNISLLQGINSAYRDHRGVLWFGTYVGVLRLDPQPDQPEPAPLALIGAVRVRGVSRTLSAAGEADISGLVLEPHQNQIQVDYVSPYFRPGVPIRFQYRLEDVDTDWSQPSEQRTVNFATLSPGTYRFVVRAITIDGVVSEKPATLAFRIRAPYRATWWFRLLIMGLIGATIYMVYQ